MLNQKIENLLKSNKKYISEKNEILKAKVYEDAVNINKELIELLLSDSKVRETYFTEINGILVFDKQGFLNFLESKDFLPDSYTAFKNKIGLTDRNGNYLSDNDDVVLSFPYKDCVLVGGQDKDDQKREEKMYNEILASEEISTLFSPKILTNIKRFGKISSQSANVTFSENDNLIIKGNNLIALASLLKRYEGKVKCIYIDPPYNTGNDSFNYNDRFNHSTWLTFMKNRLELAKRLLSDDGVIFVQCDDNEQAYLKVLMDEILGRDNFVNSLVIKMSDASGQKMTHINTKFPKIKEYVLLYKKNNIKITPIREPKNKIDKEYKIFFDVNKKILNKIKNNELIEREIYEIKEKLMKNMITFEQAKSKYNISQKDELKFFENNLYRIARTSNSKAIKKELEKQNLDSKVEIIKYNNQYILVKADYDENSDDPRVQYVFAEDTYYSPICDLWLNISTSINYEGGVAFKNAKKPEKLIFQIITASTEPDDLVLDFHLGSGTTAAVAHKMGRRYIGIEQMDYIEDMAVERLKKVIDGEEQSGISKTVNWQGGGSFIYCELKENGKKLIDSVLSSDMESIDKIKEKIFSDDRIVPYITKQELEKVDKDFLNLKLEEKKKILIDLVDKNKLYINYSDIDDEEYDISKEEKQFNDSFYKDVR